MISSLLRTILGVLLLVASSVHAEPTAGAEELPPNEPTRVAIEMALPPASADLSAEERELLEMIVLQLNEQIYRHGSLNPVPPPSPIPEGTEFIPLAPLLHVDVDAELQAAATDENGKQRKLTEEQFRQIREEGIFKVPDPKRPGQFHLWMVTAYLVKGIKNIRASFAEAQGNAYRQLRLEFPAAWAAKEDSAWSGLRKLFASVGGALASVFGGIERTPVYTEEGARAVIQEAILAKLRAGIPEQNFAIDLRLYDAELNQKAQPILESLEKSWSAEFKKMKVKLEAELRAQPVEGEPLASHQARINNALDEKYQEGLYARIETSPELNALSPSYGRYLVDQMRALQIVVDEENRLADAVKHNEAIYEEEIQNQYSLRAGDPKWLRAQVEKRSQAALPLLQMQHYRSAVNRLVAKGYYQQAYLLRETVSALSKAGPRLKKMLAERETWTVKYEVANWSGQLEARYDANIESWYEVPKTIEVSAGYPGWKIYNAIRRTAVWGSHGLHAILVDGFLNGPVGLRFWLEDKNEFSYRKMVDPKTGMTVDNPRKTFTTLRGSYAAIGASVERDRQKLKNDRPGFFGKRVETVWHYVWSEFGKGWVGRLAVTALPAASVIGAGYLGYRALDYLTADAHRAYVMTFYPAVAVLTVPWLTSAFIYDFDVPQTKGRRIVLPFFRYLLGSQTWEGGAEVISGGARGVWNLFAPIVKSGVSIVATGGRWALDKVGMAFVRKFASGVPAHNQSSVVTRVGGPGISQGYYNELDPSVALATILAVMRDEQLDTYSSGMKRKLAQPKADYEALAKRFNQYLPLELSAASRVTGLQDKSEKDLSAQVDAAVAAAKLELKPAHEMRNQLARNVKFSAADLDSLLVVTELLVKVEYTEKVIPWTDGGELGFWNSKQLPAGDWTALASRLVSDTFGEQALKPIEVTDEKFRLRVESPQVKGFIGSVLRGRGVQWDDTVRPEPNPQEDLKRHMETPLPYPKVGVSRLCANELTNLAQKILFPQTARY